jgi:ferredoxin
MDQVMMLAHSAKMINVNHQSDSAIAAEICQQKPLMEYAMKVKIDYDLCMGDRNCNKVCPEVFEYDEDQLISRVIVAEVPEHLEDLVIKAADECVPGAIIIEQ